MFSSKKDNLPAAPSIPPLKRAARSSAPSIISADLIVNGALISTGDIQVDGRVEGDVQSASLVIGDKAYVQGEITAEEVTVRGRVHGAIKARKVLLCATSHVEGNILHEAFAVETGAFFEGNCRHANNPLAEDTSNALPSPEVLPALSFTSVTRSTPATAEARQVATGFHPLKSTA